MRFNPKMHGVHCANRFSDWYNSRGATGWDPREIPNSKYIVQKMKNDAILGP